MVVVLPAPFTPTTKAKNIDILIADTAGRLHTQGSLMQELEKIKRVITKQNENAPWVILIHRQ
jgi:fused signal recognition particle receptor